jgi:hypothetical protein
MVLAFESRGRLGTRSICAASAVEDASLALANCLSMADCVSWPAGSVMVGRASPTEPQLGSWKNERSCGDPGEGVWRGRTERVRSLCTSIDKRRDSSFLEIRSRCQASELGGGQRAKMPNECLYRVSKKPVLRLYTSLLFPCSRATI